MSATNGAAGRVPNVHLMLSAEDQNEWERGLRFAHVMMSVTQEQGSEAVAMVQALAGVLVEKGIIQEDELEQMLDVTRQQVAQSPTPRVRLADPEVDKYQDTAAVEIDCASLLHLCQARCCTFQFYLTKQDLDERVARWDYGNPYWILHAEDGYCVHCDPVTRGCTIHAQRPHVCRKYDCRQDKRVWIDFEQRIPAPLPELSGNAPVAMAEIAYQRTFQAPPPNPVNGSRTAG